jgi:hypothetical protein
VAAAHTRKLKRNRDRKLTLSLGEFKPVALAHGLEDWLLGAGEETLNTFESFVVRWERQMEMVHEGSSPFAANCRKVWKYGL